MPFETMKLYDKNSIIDYFNELYDAVNEILPSMNGFRIYANARHKQWFIAINSLVNSIYNSTLNMMHVSRVEH